MQGILKFFNEAQRFGFIRPDNSNEDIFVNTADFIDKIQLNDRVEFERERSKRGINAIRVRRLF